MFNLQPWLEEAFEAEERVQQGLEEDKKIWSKENGKYLLMIKLTKKMYTFKTEEEEGTTEAFSER